MILSNKKKLLKPVHIPMVLVDEDRQYINPEVSYIRTGTGWAFVNDTLTSFSDNVPRWGARFLGGPIGLLSERQRTNSLKNNSMTGAVAGTPGTFPTGWRSYAGGISRQVVGTGTVNGMPYIDVRYFGTTAGSDGFVFQPVASQEIAALSGQTWCGSSYIAMVGGSTANLTHIIVLLEEQNSSGVGVASTQTFIEGTISSSLQYYYQKRTLNNAGTASISMGWLANWASAGLAIDITIRVCGMQIEQGNSPTSVILTTNAAVTRQGDTIRRQNVHLTPWFKRSFSMYIDAENASSDTDPGGLWSATNPDFDFNNYVQLTWESQNTPGYIQYQNRTNSATNAQMNYQPGVAARRKMLTVYTHNNNSLYVDGVLRGSDYVCDLPLITQLNIGCRFDGLEMNGLMHKCIYYDHVLNDAQGIQMTS